ncbi:MAG: guanylate kinase [Parasporobacterium sp.]|nr:guanylate kinase [Parasporobacterium sp.]
MKKGLLLVLSGFAGSGKGTIMKSIVEKYDRYALSVSATTRNPRPGEEHGREYFFMDKGEFEELIKKDKLFEYAQYVDNYYGTPKEYVEEQRNAGKDVFLEIEIQGALQIKEAVPDAVLIFVMPPSVAELKKRLVGRGTETADVIERRMKRAGEEAKGVDKYDYLLINDDIDACVEELHGIVLSEHRKVSRNMPTIDKMLDDFSKM